METAHDSPSPAKPDESGNGRTKLFRLSVFDDKRLALKFYSLDSATFGYAHGLVKEFPERRFHRLYDSWLIPWTEANLAYLAREFYPEEYDLDPDAKIIVDYHEKSRRSLAKRERRRWEYVFEDKIPELDFDFHTEPYKHQTVALDAVRNAEFFGLLMETGTGKTKVMVDEIRWSAEDRQKEGKGPLKVLIVCPKSIRMTWMRELEKHLPKNYTYWARRLSGGLQGVRDMLEGVKANTPLKIWICSYDSVRRRMELFEKVKFHLCILDESTHIKNPSAKRSRAVFDLAEYCERRVILTGTPVANSVLDLWAQFNFLRPGVLGYDSYRQFKYRYANIQKTQAGWEKVTGFRYLEELKERMAKCSFVVKKADCLDLPERNYTTRYVDMGKRQTALYNDMLNYFIASMEENFTPDGTARAQIILTKFLRLCQICSGYLKTESGETVEISDGNVKVEALADIIDSIEPQNKIIIWARFHNDIERITRCLDSKKESYVVYTGKQNEKKRAEAEDSFARDNGARIFIGEPGTGGMGLTLLGSENRRTTDVIYYNNDFSNLKRQQSEDRCYRIGLRQPITYHDIVCEGTIEQRISEILQAKKELGEYIKDYSGLRGLLLGNREGNTNE